jgi:hypothetical protein
MLTVQQLALAQGGTSPCCMKILPRGQQTFE